MTWTEADRQEFVERLLGPDATPDAVAEARAGKWDDQSIDMALFAGG